MLKAMLLSETVYKKDKLVDRFLTREGTKTNFYYLKAILIL